MRPDAHREQRFAHEYLIDLNGTQAAIRAGYSSHTAGQICQELLKKPAIYKEIARLEAERAMRTRISADSALVGIARLALSDIRCLVNPDGTIKPVDTWDEDIAMAVQSIKVVEDANGGGRITEIRLADKTRNLDLLARHLRLVGPSDKDRDASISDLLKAVLLEMRDRDQPRDVTPTAAWAPGAAGDKGPAHGAALPAPPAPDETE